MFERLCFGFVAAKHRLKLGGNLGTVIALGVRAVGILSKNVNQTGVVGCVGESASSNAFRKTTLLG